MREQGLSEDALIDEVDRRLRKEKRRRD